MVAGLTQAFASIASKLKSYTTSFSTALPQISSLGSASYATQFDAKTWSGEMVASAANVDANGEPALTESWRLRPSWMPRPPAPAGTPTAASPP